MKFGIGIHNCREGKDYQAGFTEPDDILDLAMFAEAAKFDSIWLDDHITPNQEQIERDSQTPSFLEPLVSMAQIAAVTKKISIGMGILVLIWRDPVLAAKQIATLDNFSKGRVILGVGLGGARLEFEAVNPSFKTGHRGKILDEQIEIMHSLFTQDDATYKGEYFQIDGLSFYPKPIQTPLPIYFTGSSIKTMERVAKWGQGILLKPNVTEIRDAIESLKVVLENSGRDFSEIDIALSSTMTVARTHEEALSLLNNARVSYRKDHIVGSPNEVIEQIQKLKEAGLTHFTAQRFGASDYSQLREQVQMIAEEILPAFK